MEVRIHNLLKERPAFRLAISDELFPSGSINGLVGSNGTGKTTLLHLLAGLDEDYTGTITYDGKQLNQAIRKQMTLVFQTPILLNRSVYANIEYPMKLRGIPRKQRMDYVETLLDQLAIGHLAKKNAKKLSGGESQKVALARGLSLRPSLLLLDEPFSAIDQDSIDTMMDCIAAYHQREGATVLLVSHDNDRVNKLCTHIITLG